MVGDIIPVGAVAQFHPGVALACCPEGAVAIEKERKASPALVAYQGLLVDGVAFPEPVGDGQAIGERLTTFAEEIIEPFGEADAVIIILLYVAVFVDGQGLLPGQAAQLEAVLFGSELKFAPKRGEAYIAVGNYGLILEYNIDLALAPADGGQCSAAEGVNDGGHFPGTEVQAPGKDDAGSVRIDLLPVKGGRVAAKLLGGEAGCKEQGKQEKEQAAEAHVLSL